MRGEKVEEGWDWSRVIISTRTTTEKKIVDYFTIHQERWTYENQIPWYIWFSGNLNLILNYDKCRLKLFILKFILISKNVIFK